MSQQQIQAYIVQEIKINHIAGLKKGQTIKARDARTNALWIGRLMERGYSSLESAELFKDAYDMAILELNAD